MRRLEEEKRRIESSSKIYMKKHGGKSERECVCMRASKGFE